MNNEHDPHSEGLCYMAVMSVTTSLENHEKSKNGSAEIKPYQFLQYMNIELVSISFLSFRFLVFVFRAKEYEEGAVIVMSVTLELPCSVEVQSHKFCQE